MPDASIMTATRPTRAPAARRGPPDSAGLRVVVGYDGTDAARAAVAYAARRAGSSGKVIVVYASGSPDADRGRGRDPAQTQDALRGYVLDTLLLHTRGLLQNSDFELAIVGDPPAEAIARVATERQADEIAVGRSPARPPHAPAHPVSRQLLEHADQKVTVVPQGGSQRPGEDMPRYVARVSDTGMRVARHAG
jgi:nucleotide-binding universal stress UspA family protein